MENLKCYSCLNTFSDGEGRHHGLHESCFLKLFNLSSVENFSSVATQHQQSGQDPKKDKSENRINTSFSMENLKSTLLQLEEIAIF